MKNLFLLCLCALGLLGCHSEEKDAWKPLNLLAYGLPVTILAPDSAKVSSKDWEGGVIKDVTVRGEGGYDVQIFVSDAVTTDIAKIKADQLADVKSNRFFSRIVSEEEPGFLYESLIDSSHVNYGFRYVHVQGDKEFIFQQGLASLLSLEQAQQLYEAVRPRRK